MKLDPGFLGILLLLTGLVFFLLVWGLPRLVRNRHLRQIPDTLPQQMKEDTIQSHAVLTVRPGGRVDYINPVACQWFNFQEGEQPNLEVLARHIHPTDDFLKICMMEGQGRFSVNSHPMEVISYRIAGITQLMLVSMNRPAVHTESLIGSKEISNSALKILTELSESMAARPGLSAMIQSILENVERLVPADMVEIQLWDPGEQKLTAFRFNTYNGSERQLEKGHSQPPTGYSASLIKERQCIFLADTQKNPGLSFPPSSEQTLIRSYIGLPLLVGNELIGTLEVGLNIGETYTQEDLEILQLIVGQAALAIRDVSMLETEQRRATELSGFVNLAKDLGSARDTGDLFTRLVQRITPLFDVEVLGFLVYNESSRTLVAQVPFTGIPDQVVELYHIPLFSGSQAEQRFLKRVVLMTQNAMVDDLWRELGFQDYARAASWHDTALIPLISSGHPLGYLQISNHRNLEMAFSTDEIRLLNIVVDQAAPILDNIMLVQQAHKQAKRSETLHRIASLISSSATRDEILRSSIQELARLCQSELAVIFLLDQTLGNLHLHRESLIEMQSESSELLSRLFLDETQFLFTVTANRKSFLSGHLSEDQFLPPAYRPLVESLGMESVMITPLVRQEQCLGELMFTSKKINFFNDHDMQVVSTAASSLAVVIGGDLLRNQTDGSLRQRVDQVTALTRITHELNSAVESENLLQVIYDECLEATHADCGTILLLGTQDVTPNKPGVMHHLGDEPGVELLPIEQAVLIHGEPIIVDDFTNSEYQASHEGVRSVLVVPITHQNKVVGLIHLHSHSPSCFKQTGVELVRMLAVQAAISLGNAQRFQDQVRRNELLHRRADSLSHLFETISGLAIGQPLEQSLEGLARGIQTATPFQIVVMSIIEPETLMEYCVSGVGLSPETLSMLKTELQHWEALTKMFHEDFKIGQGYFIPYDKRPIGSDGVEPFTLVQDQTDQLENAWISGDALFFPLRNNEEYPIGMIRLDAPRDGLRPDRITLETIEIYAAQTALVIQNSRCLFTYQAKFETLSTSLDRQQQQLSISQNHLPTLLHKDLEQTISIGNLDRCVHLIRAGLEITATISQQVDGPSVLQTLCREMLIRLDMSVSIVAENTADGPRLLHILGNVQRGTNPETLFGQRNPLRYCLQKGESLLVMNLIQDNTWRDMPLLTGLQAKGFICLPIIIEGKTVAGILLISLEPLPALTEENWQTYSQIARQVSVILQNISLLTDTRRRLRDVNLLLDFSRQLTGLEPKNIAKALLKSAMHVVTSAHAGVVLLYEEQEDTLVPCVAEGYADAGSLMQITYRVGESLPGRTFVEKKPYRLDEVDFARDYNLSAEYLVHYREATAGRMPVSSLSVPIQTGEQSLGVLVLDNFNTSAAFTADDVSLLLSLSQQVALSLENVHLVQTSQERAIQLQALTNVSAAMTSTLRSSELVMGLLNKLRSVLSYDTAILWLREGSHMSVSDAHGFPDNEHCIGLTINNEDSAILAEMVRTSQSTIVSDRRADPLFLTLMETEHFSWMGIPLVSKGEVVGVITLEKNESNFYTLEVTQIATTFASQASIALENAHLYEDSLHHATELDQRSQRLSMLNRLSSSLSGLLNKDQILRMTAEKLQQALSAKKVSIVTFDRSNQPVLQMSVPSNGKTLTKRLSAAPIFDRLIESLDIFCTEQVENEPDIEPLSAILKGTRSLLVLPLASGKNLRALAFVHMDYVHHFSAIDIDLARTISNQSAIALESASLYQATVLRAEQMATINHASYEIGLSLDTEQIYAAIHRAATQLMPVESFVIALLAESENEIEGVYLWNPSGHTSNLHIPLGEGFCGRVIQTGEPLLIQDVKQYQIITDMTFGKRRPRSIVAVPMTMAGKTIGMLSARSYKPNIYSKDEEQILSTLANQAAVAIQNGRLFAETRRLADELEQRVVERTAELTHEQHSTETLLRILTEASATLDLDSALNRILDLLIDAIGAEQGSILMVNPEDSSIHYRAGYGYPTLKITEDSQSTPLKLGEALAGWVIKHRNTVRIDDVRKDKRWIKIPLGSSKYQSALCAPLMVGEEIIGAIMVLHHQIGYFTLEHTNMVQAIGNQVAVAVNNAQLYNLVRNQAERLGSMLRNQQIEASRQQAILEAVADGVLVTDAENVITFLNISSERIFGLQNGQIVGHSLDGFVDLFGKAAQIWMQTIHSWSEDPTSHQSGETYAEQMTLENGRVVLVHLAPVIWRNEFLGTVSIFRDITYEVEIDQLKSEFVATVSHELRTPMTSIKGYVDILLTGAAGALNENQLHFLDIVCNNTERLNIIVNDLLDISRIEAGHVSLSLQAIDLHDVIDDIATDFLSRSQKENKPMNLTLDIPPDLPCINGDMERVRQILVNLMDNAYHYTHENGQITIHMQAVEGMVQVDVQDNGIGIDQLDADRIFERFFRGRHPLVLATPGTGLGLAIVKQLVAMHRGKIWMTSTGIPGEGCKFSFTLSVFLTEE